MHCHLSHPLRAALAAADGALFLDLLPWLLLLAALVVVGGILMYAAKRMARSGGDSVPEGFTLQSLRDLHAAGELSDEEFARAKAAMIGQVRKAAAADDSSPPEASPGESAADKTDDGKGSGPTTDGSSGM